MHERVRKRALAGCVPLFALLSSAFAAAEPGDLEARARLQVLNLRLRANWLEGRPEFWYREQLATNRAVFVRVNAASAAKEMAFDHARLAAAWQRELGCPLRPDALPIDCLRFSSDGKAVYFEGLGESWSCALDTYAVSRGAPREAAALERDPRPSRASTEPAALLFRNRTGGEIELWWIDPSGKRHSYGRLRSGGERRQNTFAGHVWQATRADGANLGVVEAREEGTVAAFDGTLPPAPPPAPDRNRSPDGRWAAEVRDHNLWLRPVAGGEAVPLSRDGTREDSYTLPVAWSADGARLLALQTREGDHRTVTLVESSPPDQVQPKVRTIRYPKPGDRVAQPRPRLFDVAARRAVPVSDALFENPWSVGEPAWNNELNAFTLSYNRRGHQVLRVLAVGCDGGVRTIVEERSDTFIDYSGKYYCHFLGGTRELLWMSERSGWNHLYRYDTASRRVLNPVTSGEWVVRGVECVDDEKGVVWLTISGLRPEESPYYVHHARVNVDGSGFTVLTAGNGDHTVAWSPDRKYLVDTWSRVDQPPVHVLRDGESGRELLVLERADASALAAAGWLAPEPFTAKGRDGKTDICGVIWRPSAFSPEKRYPVIENIYAGPHGSFAPKAFDPFHRQRRLAERDFVVVMIDGMGTSHRSKAFHDVCWKNLGDAGFPDRIAWMKAAASARPWMDLSRVGIYGGSAGGQNALRGLLMYPDFYKVGVADCGCHDNRMDKIWWNEQWMGWPVGPHYAEQSNVTQAHRLQGKLMLVVGELDENVDPSSTLQVANALVKADKDFDLVLIPGTGHGAADTPYGRRRLEAFFVRHLLGNKE